MITLITGCLLCLFGFVGVVMLGHRLDGKASWELTAFDWIKLYALMFTMGMGFILLMCTFIEVFFKVYP